MGHEEIQRKLKDYLNERMYCRNESEYMSKTNITIQLKIVYISDETLIETFSIFQIKNGQFDYFFI